MSNSDGNITSDQIGVYTRTGLDPNPINWDGNNTPLLGAFTSHRVNFGN